MLTPADDLVQMPAQAIRLRCNRGALLVTCPDSRLRLAPIGHGNFSRSPSCFPSPAAYCRPAWSPSPTRHRCRSSLFAVRMDAPSLARIEALRDRHNCPSRGALLRFLVAEGLRLAEATLEGANHA